MLPDDKEELRGSKSKDFAAVNEIKSTKKMQAEAKKQRQYQVKQELEVGNKSFYLCTMAFNFKIFTKEYTANMKNA